MTTRVRQKLVVLTGAGISAESGIPTFRGSDGLWEGHRIEDVASPEGWRRNPAKVLEFYNQRRQKALEAKPNAGHSHLVELERDFDVTIITQNIDTLHEQAGSSRVIHLHGIITQSRSTRDPGLVYEIKGWELKLGDCCELGSQLRPNIVWFGEAVPMIDTAVEIAEDSDIFVVVGTSLLVYPAAGLIHVPAASVPKYIVDPQVPNTAGIPNLTAIPAIASVGLQQLRERLQS
ncbi:MAG: NAD-dependent deacylase [Planctomycetaceae bacterium]|nr:NAD-dependent deacylase [Planctomycetaceae bacterium]